MHDGTSEEFPHACVLYIKMCVCVRKEIQQLFWEACCLLQLPCAGMYSLRRKVWIRAASHSSVAPVLQLSFQAHRVMGDAGLAVLWKQKCCYINSHYNATGVTMNLPHLFKSASSGFQFRLRNSPIKSQQNSLIDL